MHRHPRSMQSRHRRDGGLAQAGDRHRALTAFRRRLDRIDADAAFGHDSESSDEYLDDPFDSDDDYLGPTFDDDEDLDLGPPRRNEHIRFPPRPPRDGHGRHPHSGLAGHPGGLRHQHPERGHPREGHPVDPRHHHGAGLMGHPGMHRGGPRRREGLGHGPGPRGPPRADGRQPLHPGLAAAREELIWKN